MKHSLFGFVCLVWGCDLRVWRNHPQAEEPFLPSPLCEFELALPNTGPEQEGSALGKCRPRISRGLSAYTLLLCPPCHHREDSSLGWFCSHTPSKLLPAGHQEKAIKVTFIPASHHQGFQSKREHMKVSCSLMMHAHMWRGKWIYWICIPNMHW